MEVEVKMMNTRIITEALNYYNLHFNPLPVPFLIAEEDSQHTKPEGAEELYHEGGFVYPASAEQCFLRLIREGSLTEGRFCSLTPCFREEEPDELHFKMFLKLECISVLSEGLEEELVWMIKTAKDFFSFYMEVTTLKTEEGYDIIDTLTKTELGSYGIREYKGKKYIYGTGLAEPRFSQVLNKQL